MDSLPSELLDQIMGWTDLRDLHHLNLVSKQQHEWIIIAPSSLHNRCVRNLMSTINLARTKWGKYCTDAKYDVDVNKKLSKNLNILLQHFVMGSILNRPDIQFEPETLTTIDHLARQSELEPVSFPDRIQLCVDAIQSPNSALTMYRFVLILPFFKLSADFIRLSNESLKNPLNKFLTDMIRMPHSTNMGLKELPHHFVIESMSFMVMLMVFGDSAKIVQFFQILQRIFKQATLTSSWDKTPYENLFFEFHVEMIPYMVSLAPMGYRIWLKYTPGRYGFAWNTYPLCSFTQITSPEAYPTYLETCLFILSHTSMNDDDPRQKSLLTYYLKKDDEWKLINNYIKSLSNS